jgi:hypothetical protein
VRASSLLLPKSLIPRRNSDLFSSSSRPTKAPDPNSSVVKNESFPRNSPICPFVSLSFARFSDSRSIEVALSEF